MFALILKGTHNTAFKDLVSVVRGVYRVADGYQINSRSQGKVVRSWMEDPIIQNKQNDQQITVINTLQKQTQKNNFSQQKQLHKQVNTQQKIIKKDKVLNKIKQQKNYLTQLNNIKFEQKQQIKTKQQVTAIPSSRIGRIFQFGKLGISLVSTSIFSSNNKSQQHYKDIAQKVSQQLCKMRGAPLKLAQMLSIQQQSLIPAPIRRAFQKARQSAHVIPEDQVLFMMKKNLGQNWRQNFKQFNLTPFASASIGQVHKAILKNGDVVAVKIQYHGVRKSIQSDIQNLGMIMRIPGLFPKGMFVDRILKNTKTELMQQCDYQKQRKYQQLYDKCLKMSFKQQSKLFRVPKTYPQISTQQILVSAFQTGIKIKDIQQNDFSQQIRDQVGRRIMKLTFKQLFQMGIMQSDPNPSNYTFNPKQNVLNLYDFGATHTYNPKFLKNYYDIINGSVKQDNQLIWDASIRTGFVTGQQNTTMFNSHINSILHLGQPMRFKGMYDFGSQQITKKMYQSIPLMLKNRLKSPPQQVYSLHRKFSGSYLACIRLKARVNCYQIFNEIKFDTLASKQK